MGLFQDNFSSLPELDRLAAMAHDPVRIHDIGTDQWPLAMMACGLMSCNNPERAEENYPIYTIFASKTDEPARLGSLNNLIRFIAQRKGEGWQALLPYTVADPSIAISRKAAIGIITLAKPSSQGSPLAGIEILVQTLISKKCVTPGSLHALLSLSDMRALPILKLLLSQSEEQLSHWLQTLDTTPNRLSCDWLLQLLEAYPALAEEITCALCRIAPLAPMIMDIALPLPTWAYEKAIPQPLHGWPIAEYYPRLLPRLRPHLTENQLSRIKTAFHA